MSNTIIEVKNINKIYGGKKILNGISLAAKDKEVITIIGTSGTGKSTFLKCINLLNNPSEGQIFLGNEEIALERGKDGDLYAKRKEQLLNLRQKVGFVFQDFNLWKHRTILENVTEAPIYALKQKKQDAIVKAEMLLSKVGLCDKRFCYAHELSGGQQQRVAIARALAMNPEVILLDEPTSALDPEKTKEVTDVLLDLANDGVTMIIVTHEMSFCKEISSRVVFLNEGKIEEEGTPSEVFDNPKSERLHNFLSNTNQ